jgi:hypothetical protein
MRGKAPIIFAISAATTVGCGGGGGSVETTGAGTAYSFVPPVAGVIRVLAETIVDNSNNTIDIGYSDSVSSVNSDGTYAALVQSTTGDSSIVNGTNYAVVTQNENYDDSGQELSYTFTGSTGVAVTCSYTPHASGPDFPVQVGQTWQIQYTLSCDDGSVPITYTQQGSVVAVESVTVPAGTFTALKFQSTVTWTNAQGTARNESTTNWRDTKTLYSVKQQIAIAVSGTTPANGYPVSRTIELQSISGTS